RAEARGRVHVGRGEDHVDRVLVEAEGRDLVGHDLLDLRVAERGAEVGRGRRLGQEADRVRDVRAGRVVVGRVDVEVGRAAEVAQEVGEARGRVVAGPAAVPDVVDVDALRAGHDVAAVEGDAVLLARAAAAAVRELLGRAHALAGRRQIRRLDLVLALRRV